MINMFSRLLLRFKRVTAVNVKAAKNRKITRRFTSTKAKRMFSFFRWLHIYISCALFSLLLFFCITGVTLNHLDWVSDEPAQITSFTLPSALTQLSENAEYPMKKIQTYVEKKIGLSNPRSIDYSLDLGEITYDFLLPSGYVFVTIILEEQLMEVESVHGGLLALLNDLHKGRNSGEVWSWVIDISAILMGMFTITGLLILLQNSKYRRRAFFILLLGSFTPIVLYFLAVPRIYF